jgi:hypothetical protein
MLVDITTNLQLSMERLATTNSHLIGHHARETMERIEALGREQENGGMFA